MSLELFQLSFSIMKRHFYKNYIKSSTFIDHYNRIKSHQYIVFWRDKKFLFASFLASLLLLSSSIVSQALITKLHLLSLPRWSFTRTAKLTPQKDKVQAVHATNFLNKFLCGFTIIEATVLAELGACLHTGLFNT